MRLTACVLLISLTAGPLAVAGDPFPIQTPPDERTAGFAITVHESTPAVVWCPPGKFTMGSPETEEYRDDDEAQVKVDLTEGFWIGREEVTQSQWEAVMKTRPWRDRKSAEDESIPENDLFPASCVSWQDAMDFCKELTKRERQAGRLTGEWKYTLPSEAQWEYACRAGSTTAYCFGDDAYGNVRSIGRYAWYNANVMHTYFVYEGAKPHVQKVRRKEPNAWQIHDMHGNVFEWCLDWYEPKLIGGKDPVALERPDNENPSALGGNLALDSAKVVLAGLGGEDAKPATSGSKVIRGGAWRCTFPRARSANRDALTPTVRADYYGFRVALVPTKP